MIAGDNLLDSTTVMARYGYKSRSRFWEFVKKKGVPHITFNARKIMFSPAALEAWEAKRSTGKIK